MRLRLYFTEAFAAEIAAAITAEMTCSPKTGSAVPMLAPSLLSSAASPEGRDLVIGRERPTCFTAASS